MDLAICVRNLPARILTQVGHFAEQRGYTDVFVPDGATSGSVDVEGRLLGRDTAVAFAAMFAGTTTVRGVLGVAATPMHHPLVLPTTVSTLFEMSEGRFSVGLGVSHPEQTARFGISFPERPVGYMRTWAQKMKASSAAGMAYGGGWKVLIAALGRQMIELGAREADGLILNWLTPAAATEAVRLAKEAAPDGTVPRTVLYLRLMTPEASRHDAKAYDALTNYHRNFVAQGLATPDDIVAGTTLPMDDLGAAKERLDEYRAAGLDSVCLYPAGFDRAVRIALEGLTG